MNSKKNKQPKKQAKIKKYGTKNILVNYFLTLMFTIFPLFFTNEYFNIRHDKYGLFVILALVIIIAELGIIAINAFDSAIPTAKNKKKLWEYFNFTDWAAIALLVFSIISTLLSEHKFDALAGTAGRNNGLILIAIYVGIYFVITRFFSYMEYVFAAFAGTSIIVFLLAIVNCFYLDPLGMYVGLTDTQTIANFTSTIGNKNLMSSYICIALPVMIAMSVITKNNILRILYLCSSGFGFASLMTADSDSGILGIGFIAVVFLIWFSKQIERLKRFFLSLTVMLIFAKILRLFSYFMKDFSKGMDNFQEFFVYDNKSYILLVALAIITVLLYIIDFKKKNLILPTAVPITLSSIAIIGVIFAVAVVINYSVFDTEANLGSFETLIRFNDKWGTHRGFMWIRSLWIFNDFSFLQKIFGCGPDNFYYAFEPYFSDLIKYGDASTNAAHNEYINYLITLGIAGTLAYILFIGSAIFRAIKAANKNPIAIVFAVSAICYAVQAVVNIAQPITTPLFIIFIALCEAAAKK